MDRLSVLVTGVGSPTGMAVARTAAEDGHYVIGVDPDDRAPGFMFCHKRLQGGWANDPELPGLYADHWRRHEPDVAVVTIVDEYEAARTAGLRGWFPSPEAVEVTTDKQAFADRLLDNGIPHPPTGRQPLGSGPWWAKPVRGEGSRRTWKFEVASTFKALLNEHPDLIVQPDLPGNEFGADVMFDGGELVGGCAFWKHRTSGSITMSATSFPLDEVGHTLARVGAACGLDGPVNFDGFRHGRSIVVLEANPRFSHCFELAEAAGSKLLRYYLQRATQQEPRRAALAARPGFQLDRYYSGNVCVPTGARP